MITLIKVVLVNFVLYLLPSNNCNLLPNGTYKFIQTVSSSGKSSKIISETRVVIADSIFTQYWNNGDSAQGKIDWIYDCTFKLIYLGRQSVDTSEFGKLLLKSFGDPCFELKGKRGNKIKFRTTYLGNLHVTTSEGTITKPR